MIFRKYLFCLLSTLLSLTVTAQPSSPFTVVGQVHDIAARPLELATVLLIRATDSSMVTGTVSDATGTYALGLGLAGTFRVLVQQVGYQKTYSLPFTFTPGQSAYQLPPLVLSETPQTLGMVTVTAAKPFIEQLPDKTIVHVENSIVASGGTALEALERSPGVTVDSQNERITLRGRDGVLVMIDGKPTYLSMPEVINLLRNTPSNSVQSIELITNPSAKYDAAGNSGIINIRLKRNTSRNDGTNGSGTLGVGYGRFPKASVGLTANHRKGPLTFFSNYNYDNRQGYGSVDARRQFGTGDSLTTVRNLGYRPNTNKTHTLKAGADFVLGKSTSLGLLVNGTLSNDRAEINNRNLVHNAAGQLQQTVTMINTSTRALHWRAANASFKHSFDTLGQEVTVDADFSRVSIDPQDMMRTRYFNAFGEETQPAIVQRNTPPSTITIRAAKADYVHPLTKQTKVEAGGKVSYVSSDNSVVFETLTAGEYVPDPQRTNHFLYDETIAAGYLNGSHSWQKWSLQTGLRLEHTRSLGNSVTLKKLVDRSYTNLFPSVFLSYKASPDHQWRGSYSRRVDRPNYGELNPFIYVMDPYTYREGNPFLRPQYTHSFQLGYTYKQQANISLSYNQTTDVITGVNNQMGQVLRVTTVNLASLNNVNLSIDYPVTLAKWWNLRPSVNVFLNAYDAAYAGLPLDYRHVSANLNMNHSFVLPHGLTAELTGFYNSPLVYGMLRTTGFGQISAGIQKNLWNKAGTLRLNVSDLFWTMRPGGTIRHATTNLQFSNRFESRVARLTFTYNVGNQKLKANRQRRSGVEEEQNRVGND